MNSTTLAVSVVDEINRNTKKNISLAFRSEKFVICRKITSIIFDLFICCEQLTLSNANLYCGFFLYAHFGFTVAKMKNEWFHCIHFDQKKNCAFTKRLLFTCLVHSRTMATKQATTDENEKAKGEKNVRRIIRQKKKICTKVAEKWTKQKAI